MRCRTISFCILNMLLSPSSIVLVHCQAATKIQMLVQSNVHRSVEELEALLADAQSVLLELREKVCLKPFRPPLCATLHRAP